MRWFALTGLAGLILAGVLVGRSVSADHSEVILSCKGTNATGDGFQVTIERLERGYQARVALIEKQKMQIPEAPFPVDDPLKYHCGKIVYDASPRFKLLFTPPDVKPHKPGTKWSDRPHVPGTAEADYAKSPVRRLENMKCTF